MEGEEAWGSFILQDRGRGYGVRVEYLTGGKSPAEFGGGSNGGSLGISLWLGGEEG